MKEFLLPVYHKPHDVLTKSYAVIWEHTWAAKNELGVKFTKNCPYVPKMNGPPYLGSFSIIAYYEFHEHVRSIKLKRYSSCRNRGFSKLKIRSDITAISKIF